MKSTSQFPAWQPIASMPEIGEFLVYMPDEPDNRKIQVFVRVKIQNGVMDLVGGNFAFDLTKPKFWMDIPEAPE